MCLGIEAVLIEVRKRKAIAEAMGVKREVSVELIENAKEGDKVMVHAGTVIAKIESE